MNIVEFLKLETYICSNCFCSECPLHSSNNGRDVSCDTFKEYYSEEAVTKIKDWGKENGLIK